MLTFGKRVPQCYILLFYLLEFFKKQAGSAAVSEQICGVSLRNKTTQLMWFLWHNIVVIFQQIKSKWTKRPLISITHIAKFNNILWLKVLKHKRINFL